MFRHFGRGELLHVQIFANDGPNPLTWDAQLLRYWFSRNPAVFPDYLVNLINNLRGGHCFESSRTKRITGGKITALKLGHSVFTVAYDGACFPDVSLRIAWISFDALRCGKIKTWQLSPRCWNRARRLTCFLSASVTRKACNSAHKQTPLSNDTIDSVLRHRKVGRAKDLSAPPRNIRVTYVRSVSSLGHQPFQITVHLVKICITN